MELTEQPQLPQSWDLPKFTSAAPRLDAPSSYMLSKARTTGDRGPLDRCMASRTVYVGHLSLSTTEEQLYELFASAGVPERVIMGLNAHTMAPTGFCFVVFATQRGATNAVKYINKTRLNGRTIDVDLDPGFEEGRQFGRGDNGAQRQSQFARRGGRGRGGHGHGHPRDRRGGRGRARERRNY